jgi:DNA (cytosine-5)-methyltransferase 1
MLDLLERFLPRVLLIENVPGFLRGSVSALPYIKSRLGGVNRANSTRYELHASVVDAAQFGVPQHRKRVIAVACRDGSAFQLPDPTHAGKPMRAWDAIGDLDEPDALSAMGAWADLLPSIPEGSNYQYLTARGGGEELFGYRTRYWSFLLKLAKDRPAWTLSANPGSATGPFHWDNRPLTIKERLRLQSFPDEWRLAGGLSSQIRQAGNATPPLLAEVIGRAVVSQVLDPHHEWNGEPRLLQPRGGEPPEPRPPAPVPRRYRKDIGPRAPHPGPGRGPAPRQALSDDASDSSVLFP